MSMDDYISPGSVPASHTGGIELTLIILFIVTVLCIGAGFLAFGVFL